MIAPQSLGADYRTPAVDVKAQAREKAENDLRRRLRDKCSKTDAEDVANRYEIALEIRDAFAQEGITYGEDLAALISEELAMSEADVYRQRKVAERWRTVEDFAAMLAALAKRGGTPSWSHLLLVTNKFSSREECGRWLLRATQEAMSVRDLQKAIAASKNPGETTALPAKPNVRALTTALESTRKRIAAIADLAPATDVRADYVEKLERLRSALEGCAEECLAMFDVVENVLKMARRAEEEVPANVATVAEVAAIDWLTFFDEQDLGAGNMSQAHAVKTS